MQNLRRISDSFLKAVESSIGYVKAHQPLSITIASAFVLLIMVYGTYVSVVLPKQRMELLRAAYAEGNYASVIDVGQKIVDADPNNIKAALALASSIIQQGQLDGNIFDVIDRARDVLRGASAFATQNDDQSEIQQMLGFSYLITNELDRAGEYLNKAIEYNNQNSMAHAQLCQYHHALNKNAQAREACSRALEIDSENAIAMIGIAKSYIEVGDIRQSRLYAESAIIAAPDKITKAKAYVAAAHVEVLTQNLDGANDYVKESLRNNVNEFDALVLYGELAMRRLAYAALSGGEPTEDQHWRPMLKAAAQAMRINPKDYYPYFLFMRAYEVSGNSELAERHRSIALRLVNSDQSLDSLKRKTIINRLNASQNVKLTGIKLVNNPSGEALEGAIQGYIIKP